MAIPPFRVKALYDYSSQEEDDLKFLNGQIILVTDEEDADWYYGEYEDGAGDKREGLFPKNFVKVFEPDMPPRPTRSGRPKKENDTLVLASDESRVHAAEEPGTFSSPVPSKSATIPEQAFEEPEPPVSQGLKAEIQSAPTPARAQIPAPKAALPPAAEKSTSGSFRDRINAFNRSTAPPPAPSKPSGLGTPGGSAFVKKAFVAPPPSKNAYVPRPREPPPQKVYRREEVPEKASAASTSPENGVQASQSQVPTSAEVEEDQPKPTTLKDRIALLQKQQMEQVARHAEASQKKEKPKRPVKMQEVPQESAAAIADSDDGEEGGHSEGLSSIENTGNRSIETSREIVSSDARYVAPSRFQEATPLGSPTTVTLGGFVNDQNDTDQSGTGETEEGEDFSTGREGSDEKPKRKASIPPQASSQAPLREADVEYEEDNADEGDVEEEEDMDPEVKRRMEIRERMAKMSGGMGLAGMFGPPAGMAPRAPAKRGTASSERDISGASVSGQTDDGSHSRAPPVPIVPMPGLQKVRSPEQQGAQLELSHDDAFKPQSMVQVRGPEDMPDVEDIIEEPIPNPRRSAERLPPPPVPQDRPVPAPPSKSKGIPPPLPAERPVPPTPSESRRVSRPPPSQPMSPSEGSESDDEMSLRRSSMRIHPGAESSRPVSRDDPGPVPSAGPPPSLPSRPPAPQTRPSDYTGRSPPMQSIESSSTLPKAPADSSKRTSRVPPIPGSSPAIPSAPQNRAPPPPPPINATPVRTHTGDSRISPPVPTAQTSEESDEEVTAYEGDYDTDIASGATHKDALKAHAQVSSLEDDSITEEAGLHHSSLPSLGPGPSSALRAVPPPPPNQPSRNHRQSSDMPRGAPPLPPPPKQQIYEDDDHYNSYMAHTSGQRSSDDRHEIKGPTTPRFEEPEAMFQASSPQWAGPTFSSQNTAQYPSSPSMTALGRSGPRQSTEMQRTSTSVRRSTDASRPSGEQGFIAGDVDLGHNSQWWAQADTPPPVFQNRRDLIFETEETSITRRGGKHAVTKMVYVLFMDYSQTLVTAQFEAKNPVNADLEQRHEPPPQILRQDQLENAHARFGTRIAEAVNAKKETVAGDGTPHALIIDLVSSLPEALPPVGVRAYGANVYANLANASVRQFDEIRPGDIVTFRNAKFQGHRGPMHSKYSVEVGKPDHVGIVIDWDGTKKKVRAWEQGRENKKIKPESFKFGDLRSGEVKVWRVMARNWVGWN